MVKIKEFLKNVVQEWNKTTWPTNKEWKTNSINVFAFMVVLSLFFFAIDGAISVGMAAVTPEPQPFFPPIFDEIDFDFDFDDVGIDYEDYDNGEEDAE